MFLNGLKVKSILRKIQSYSIDRQYVASNVPVKRIGLLQDENMPFSKTKLTALAKMLGIKEGDVEVMTFVRSIPKEQKEQTDIFTNKHVGWKGVLKAKYLKTFGSTRFDVLISYYKEEHLPLQAVTGYSQSVFKVGLYSGEFNLNDLVISTEAEQETVFIAELKKYLEILKII